MKRKILALAVSFSMAVGLCGCSGPSFSQILQGIVTGAIDVIDIIAVAKSATPDAAAISKIQADGTAIASLYATWQTATGTQKQTVEGDINAAFTTLTTDMSAFFQLTGISNVNTQNKVTALVSLLQQSVALAESFVPATSTKAAPQPVLTATSLEESWNKTVVAKTGDSKVDSITGKMQLHQHSRFVRILSLGTAH